MLVGWKTVQGHKADESDDRRRLIFHLEDQCRGK